MPQMPIDALAQEILQRELARDPEQFRAPQAEHRPAPDSGLTPSHWATIGGLADAASTYYFRTQGRPEANPLLKNLSPAMTGLGALGGLALTKAATALIRKKSPRLADVLAANLGAEQFALSVSNLQPPPKRNSYFEYRDAMDRYRAPR